MVLFRINKNDLHNIKDDIKNIYETEGAFIVENLLEVNIFNEIIEDLVNICFEYDPRLYKKYGSTTNNLEKANKCLLNIYNNKNDDQGIIYDAMTRSISLHKFAAEKNIINILESILSKKILIHNKLILIMSMPNQGWHLARWHQDYYYNEGPKNTCTIYAPLQRTNSYNGGLIIAKNSPLKGLLEHSDNIFDPPTKYHTIRPDEINNFCDIDQVKISMNPGDVLFMHSLCAHSAQINQSNYIRFVVNLRYQDLTDKDFKSSNWKVDTIPHARIALNRKV